MNEMQKKVIEFHRACGVPVSGTPTTLNAHRQELRIRLIKEELQEYIDSARASNIIGIADALGDLLVVIFGTAVEHGLNMQPIFDEIHQSNMSKRNKDGSVSYDAGGKVMKGEGYKPPDLWESIFGDIMMNRIASGKP